MDIYQHWLTVGESLARCNLDGKQVEKERHVAAYLNTVKDSELTKQLWEKRDNHDNMEKYIKASVEADREFEKLHKKPNRVKVKEEPINKFDKNRKKSTQKQKNCFRCGEPGWTKEHIKVCKARKHQCENCRKRGHMEKLCRKNKKGNEKSRELMEMKGALSQKQQTQTVLTQKKLLESWKTDPTRIRATE